MSGLLRAGPYGSSSSSFTSDLTASEHFAANVTVVTGTSHEGQQAAEVALGLGAELPFALEQGYTATYGESTRRNLLASPGAGRYLRRG
jgi:hypothetical protein